jgi:hypothetical protein
VKEVVNQKCQLPKWSILRNKEKWVVLVQSFWSVDGTPRECAWLPSPIGEACVDRGALGNIIPSLVVVCGAHTTTTSFSSVLCNLCMVGESFRLLLIGPNFLTYRRIQRVASACGRKKVERCLLRRVWIRRKLIYETRQDSRFPRRFFTPSMYVHRHLSSITRTKKCPWLLSKMRSCSLLRFCDQQYSTGRAGTLTLSPPSLTHSRPWTIHSQCNRNHHPDSRVNPLFNITRPKF